MPAWLERAAAWSWRLLVVAAAAVVVLWVLRRLRIVVLPVIIAVFLATVMVPITRFFQRRGLPNLASVWLSVIVFLGVVVGAGLLVVPAMISEFSDLGPTLSDALDDVEDWLVTGPPDLSRQEVERYRQDLGQVISDTATSGSSQPVISGATLVGEILAGIVLALVAMFFIVKDRELITGWLTSLLPDRHRETWTTIARRSWQTLGGFLRGTAILGTVEAVIIGGALFVMGATLVVPVMVLTFFAAFIPFVGAITAGIVAVLVAFVSGGLTDALVIAVVALLVQQLDGDLLAPIILGRAVHLHPLAILVSVTAGGVLAGLAGAFLAVPTVAVAMVVLQELRSVHQDADPAT